MREDTIEVIISLISGKGDRAYGLSSVNQRAHALQAAWLAEQAGCQSPLIVAALVHDSGHMVHDLGDDPAKEGIDDHHEDLGAAWLVPHFGLAVTEPVRLHVAAKRYLCGTEADYFARLAPDSVRSLALQGGPMNPHEIAGFDALAFGADAVRLRRFDEQAKVKGLATPDARHFLPHIRACVLAA